MPAGEERHFFVPFEVPVGIVEIEVRHDDLSDANILDWGLEDPRGFRGWGGGNTEPAVVGELAASRSYVPGPIGAGTRRVVVGEAKILEQPARYRIEVVLRDAPTSIIPCSTSVMRASAVLGSSSSIRGESTSGNRDRRLAAIRGDLHRGCDRILQGPDDPMLELTASAERTLHATVTAGVGTSVRFVRNLAPLEAAVVDTDPFVHELAITPPPSGEDRHRAEVLVDDHPRTVTSHLWIAPAVAPPRVEASGGYVARAHGMERRAGHWHWLCSWLSSRCVASLTRIASGAGEPVRFSSAAVRSHAASR